MAVAVGRGARRVAGAATGFTVRRGWEACRHAIHVLTTRQAAGLAGPGASVAAAGRRPQQAPGFGRRTRRSAAGRSPAAPARRARCPAGSGPACRRPRRARASGRRGRRGGARIRAGVRSGPVARRGVAGVGVRARAGRRRGRVRPGALGSLAVHRVVSAMGEPGTSSASTRSAAAGGDTASAATRAAMDRRRTAAALSRAAGPPCGGAGRAVVEVLLRELVARVAESEGVDGPWKVRIRRRRRRHLPDDLHRLARLAIAVDHAGVGLQQDLDGRWTASGDGRPGACS